MRHLIKAELLKLHTTRTFWGSVAGAAAFVPASVALAITSGSSPLASGEGVRNVMASASSGAIVLLVVGILVSAGEFRHATATSTFLITPDRRRVVLAKLAATSLVGVAVAVATSLLTLAVALPWLAHDSAHPSAYGSDIALGLLGALAATALSPLVGVGLGALVRSQTAAITLALVWSQVVESLLIGFQPRVGRWLPGGAASALTGAATPSGGLLPMWAAALVLAGYALCFAAAGSTALTRRDIA